MTDQEAAEVRANIAALWEAIRQLNMNDQNMLSNITRLSHRLVLQEAALVVEEMEDPTRGLH